jgi:hypothetical protein
MWKDDWRIVDSNGKDGGMLRWMEMRWNKR